MRTLNRALSQTLGLEVVKLAIMFAIRLWKKWKRMVEV
jgi:hypothetical protein